MRFNSFLDLFSHFETPRPPGIEKNIVFWFPVRQTLFDRKESDLIHSFISIPVSQL